MTRHQNTIDAELEALERALNGDAGADPILTELIREVRADAPSFDGPARASLDARVDAGFPREQRSWVSRFAPSGALFRPSLAIAATALLGIAVTTTALKNDAGGGDTAASRVAASPSTQEAAADDQQEPEATVQALEAGGGAAAAPPSTASADSAAPSSGAARQSAPAEGEVLQDSDARFKSLSPMSRSVGSLAGRRIVERSAELALTAKPQDVQGVANDVIRTVQGLGGVVASSRISTATDGGEATFDLRLPTSKLDQAIGQLSKLASVSGLTQDSQDITGSFVSARDRLQDARDERKALLKALGRATTDRQVSSLRARIADSRRRIAAAQADIQRLKNRTDKATVALTITGDPSAADDKKNDEGGAWTPGDAAGDAWRVLEVAAGVAVIAAAALVPLGLLGLLAYLAARVTRRRGRERALDATA